MEYRVLIAHTEFDDLSVEQEVLGRINARVDRASVKEWGPAWENAHAVMVSIQRLDADFISRLARCRIIARVGTGVDAIDTDCAARHGIWVTNVPDAFSDDVSIHAMALILALARSLPRLFHSTRSGAWDSKLVRPLHSLRGCTLGIVGFGRIGRALAEKARAFGMEILFHDPMADDHAGAGLGARRTDLAALLAASDFVSVHVPLTETTRNLFNTAAFSLMKPGAFFVNTSRGGLVDETALLQALRAGVVAGAALDVMSVEPPGPGNPLLSEENVLVTPHIAWYSEESTRNVRVRAAEEIVRVLGGSKPMDPVNSPARPRR